MFLSLFQSAPLSLPNKIVKMLSSQDVLHGQFFSVSSLKNDPNGSIWQSGISKSLWEVISIEGCLPFRVIFHQRSYFIKGCLPSKVRLPLKAVFHQRSPSNAGCLPPKVVFHQRSSSNKGHLPSRVIFQRRSSSIQGCLPSKVIFH